MSWAGAVHAIVGPTDVCPLPTPYPPASAGAGVIFNGDMEQGCSAGAAAQWVAWQDGGHTAAHVAGTDRFFSGAAAQRVNMPQPSASIWAGEAGLYQQIWGRLEGRDGWRDSRPFRDE